tara:strand:+ start:821 stop:2398 length:1578 start_codon:yes stop_codon:yes gene_type:complete
MNNNLNVLSTIAKQTSPIDLEKFQSKTLQPMQNVRKLESQLRDESINMPSTPRTKLLKQNRIDMLKKELEDQTYKVDSRIKDFMEPSFFSDIERNRDVQGSQALFQISRAPPEDLSSQFRQLGFKQIIEQEVEEMKNNQGASLQSLMKLATTGPSLLNRKLFDDIATRGIKIALRECDKKVTDISVNEIKEKIINSKNITARNLLGDVSTQNQCIKTIGDPKVGSQCNNYLSLFNDLKVKKCNPTNFGETSLTNFKIDVLSFDGNTPQRKCLCWLCGLPIGPLGQDSTNPLSPECEHVLPVSLAQTFFDIYSSKSARGKGFAYPQALSPNYGWAHKSCNAWDKGHFDANPVDQLIKFIPDGQNGGKIVPVPETYKKIVNGWDSPQKPNGIKNRLLSYNFGLNCLTPMQIEEWAKSRIEVINNTYIRICNQINAKLTANPKFYGLSLIGFYMDNISRIAKNNFIECSDTNVGQKRKRFDGGKKTKKAKAKIGKTKKGKAKKGKAKKGKTKKGKTKKGKAKKGKLKS